MKPRYRIEFLTEEQCLQSLKIAKLFPTSTSRYWDKNPETGMYMWISLITFHFSASSLLVGKGTKMNELSLYSNGIVSNETTLKIYNPSALIHNVIGKDIPKLSKQTELDCPFDFTSRCTLGQCDCKPK